MKMHTIYGYRLFSGSDFEVEQMIAEVALNHHEKWDGTGYPRALKGEEIPLQARIIAIADAYDAMTSERSYRAPIPESIAVKELLDNAGTQFDPWLTKIFIDELSISNGE